MNVKTITFLLMIPQAGLCKQYDIFPIHTSGCNHIFYFKEIIIFYISCFV